ncbi:N-6 DNA methylase [Sporolactobacillus spathodeae]|uniref:DNA methylase adenine-specific domain-containing protein n=1 Tax=Sporolactobacillus spathodeae TaxID=1465502 RepID=A0ABS2QAJ1_9BACL|nr:N-6 DNA methylase [Sporolactobacillus spathodeae]MBM7658455.1 hypothetical protein [Sporolactobacillus spathodeae]
MVDEKLIKSSQRVREHGEVFTPKRIVKLMLDQKELQENLHSLTATFLEPAAGEGAFLTEILHRKLCLAEKMSATLAEYEQNSLIALSSLYGIELLEDNVEMLVMNMFGVFYRAYLKQVEHYTGTDNRHVIDSAKIIIQANMAQGDALKQTTTNGRPIIFSEWQLLPVRRGVQKVQRTEYTLGSIMNNSQPPVGSSVSERVNEQLELFVEVDNSLQEYSAEHLTYRYVPVKITEVYKELVEEV